MDPNYIEHDSYCMFNSVMFVVESWFNNDVIYCKVSQLS